MGNFQTKFCDDFVNYRKFDDKGANIMVENIKKFSVGQWILVAVGVLLVVLLFWGIGSYNSIVKLKENVETQSSNIDTELERRVSLIPNLVNTVKGYSMHETEILEAVASSRSKLAGASTMQEKSEANSEVTSSLNRLLMVVENYPELKASSQYTQLMDELAGTESRISVARRDYNSSAKTYNQKIKSFPAVIIANMFGFSQSEYFGASEASQEVPSVSFQ